MTHMPRLRPIAALAALAWCAGLSGCARPSASDYVVPGAGLTGKSTAARSIGTNRLGEPCSVQSDSGSDQSIYCGEWQQPSVRIHADPKLAGNSVSALATTGPWRAELDLRYECGAPSSVSIQTGEPAMLLSCTQRVGGWPHFGLVTIAGGRAFLMDGVDAAEPVGERLIAEDTGRAAAERAQAGNEGLVAQRLAAAPIKAGDIGRFYSLVVAASNADRAGDHVSAEVAYRRALEVQTKALGEVEMRGRSVHVMRSEDGVAAVDHERVAGVVA